MLKSIKALHLVNEKWHIKQVGNNRVFITIAQSTHYNYKKTSSDCLLTIGKTALDAAFGAFDINDCALRKI